MQERFKQLLEDKKLTATQFAAMIKVNASAMSHILNGRSKPSFDVLAKVGQAFPDVNLNFLISGKGDLYNNIRPSAPQIMQEEKTSHPGDLFSDSPTETAFSKEIETPVSSQPVQEIIQTGNALVASSKKMKRIVLFFDDGSFEDYTK